MSGLRILAFEGNLEVIQAILRKTITMVVFRDDYVASVRTHSEPPSTMLFQAAQLSLRVRPQRSCLNSAKI